MLVLPKVKLGGKEWWGRCTRCNIHHPIAILDGIEPSEHFPLARCQNPKCTGMIMAHRLQMIDRPAIPEIAPYSEMPE